MGYISDIEGFMVFLRLLMNLFLNFWKWDYGKCIFFYVRYKWKITGSFII